MEKVNTFNFKGHDVREITRDGKPWFVLIDACRSIGIKSSVTYVVKRLNPEGVGTIHLPTKGGIQPLIIIDEPNLYKFVLQSRKPEADAFVDFVTKKILPEVRETGSYNAPKTLSGDKPGHDSGRVQQVQDRYMSVAEYLTLQNARHPKELCMAIGWIATGICRQNNFVTYRSDDGLRNLYKPVIIAAAIRVHNQNKATMLNSAVQLAESYTQGALPAQGQYADNNNGIYGDHDDPDNDYDDHGDDDDDYDGYDPTADQFSIF